MKRLIIGGVLVAGLCCCYPQEPSTPAPDFITSVKIPVLAGESSETLPSVYTLPPRPEKFSVTDSEITTSLKRVSGKPHSYLGKFPLSGKVYEGGMRAVNDQAQSYIINLANGCELLWSVVSYNVAEGVYAGTLEITHSPLKACPNLTSYQKYNFVENNEPHQITTETN